MCCTRLPSGPVCSVGCALWCALARDGPGCVCGWCALQERRSVTVAVRTRPTAVFAQDQVLLDLEANVRWPAHLLSRLVWALGGGGL